MAKRVVLEASIVRDGAANIRVRAAARYAGGQAALSYDLAESGSEAWFASIAADTHVGICGGGSNGSSCYGWQAHAGGV